MRHLVAQHRGQFRGVAGERDQAARYIKLPGRQGERVHRPGIEDRDPVGLVGPIGRSDQPVDRLADQRCQLRIVIGAAIGGEDALMLALARRGLDDGAVWLRCRRSGRGGLQFSDIAAGRNHEAGAQQRRRGQEAAARLLLAPCCTMRQISHWNHDPIGLDRIMPPSLCLRMTISKTGAQFSNHALCPAQHLNLPRPKQFDSWSSPRPDIAADTNPFIFE